MLGPIRSLPFEREELGDGCARRCGHSWVRFVAIAVIVVLGAASVAASAGAQTVQTLDFKGTQPSSAGNLIDHGGPVLSASHAYAIFWGPASGWAPDVGSGLQSLFQGLDGSNYLGIGQQYMRGAGIGSSYVLALSDSSSPPPTHPPKTSEIAGEVGAVLTANGLATDPTGIYLVYTSSFPKNAHFCSWHFSAPVNGVTTQFAYVPNTGLAAGCDPGNRYGVSGSEDLRSLANVTAHELMEAVTDSQSTAWYDSSGAEIADKCAWQFSGPVTLTNGTVWQLQEEWSNMTSACAQGQ
jgi:hypothetical protein